MPMQALLLPCVCALYESSLLVTCDTAHCHAPCHAQLLGNARAGRWRLPGFEHQMQGLLHAVVRNHLRVRAGSGGVLTMLGGTQGWSKVGVR